MLDFYHSSWQEANSKQVDTGVRIVERQFSG
jgi:hypothetical protein